MFRRRPLAGLVAGLATTLALGASAVPAHAADSQHTDGSWTWTGPETWEGSPATYSIDITGSSGARLAFQSALGSCPTGATWDAKAGKFFKAKRAELKSNGFTLSNVSAISDRGGKHRRQKISIAVKFEGQNYVGVAVFDQDYVPGTSNPESCWQQTDARVSVKSAWSSRGPKLAAIRKSLATSGPVKILN